MAEGAAAVPAPLPPFWLVAALMLRDRKLLCVRVRP